MNLVELYELCNDCLLFETNDKAKANILNSFGDLNNAINSLEETLEGYDNALSRDARAKLVLVENRTNNPNYIDWVFDNYELFIRDIYQVEPDLEDVVYERRSIREEIDLDKLRAEALELISKVIDIPESVYKTKLKFNEKHTSLFDVHEDTIYLDVKDTYSNSLLVLIHEYVHAIHYAYVRNTDLPDEKRLITRFGLSSALKEGVGYVLMEEAAGEKYKEEAEKIISWVYARAFRELTAFKNRDEKRIKEFLRLPGYKICYAVGIDAVRELRKDLSWEEILNLGFVNLEEVQSTLQVS